MDNINVVEEFSPHHYRTEIPNIVEEALTDVYERSLYLHLKRRAGDAGQCKSCKKSMAESTGMSPRKLQDVKKSLSMPRKELGNRPLIKISQRKTESGGQTTDLITIVNMWDLNFSKCFNNDKSNVGGGASDARGGGIHVLGGQARHAPKEEPFKEEQEELFVADEPGGPPPEKIRIRNGEGKSQEIDQSDLFRRAIREKKNWKTAEISEAWTVLRDYGKIVHDWFRFIEGTIEKIRNRHKSKKASESEARKNTKKEKQKCNQTLTPKQKTCKEPSSESDTQEQPSQKSEISIMELVDKYRSGLRNRPATS